MGAYLEDEGRVGGDGWEELGRVQFSRPRRGKEGTGPDVPDPMARSPYA